MDTQILPPGWQKYCVSDEHRDEFGVILRARWPNHFWFSENLKRKAEDNAKPLLPILERERERERESFVRNNLHNGVVSGAARGQALRGPMWAGLTRERERERALLGAISITGWSLRA